MRSTLCTLAHISWGLIIGSYVAIAKFTKANTLYWIGRGLLIAIGLHFLYDGFLMSIKSDGHLFYHIALAAGIDLSEIYD